MSSERIFMLGGPALVVGAIVNIITTLYGDVLYEGFRPTHAADSSWGLVNLLSLVAGILVVLGFTAVYARQAPKAGALGLWGWVLTTSSGMLFGVAFAAIFLVAVPLLSAEDKKLFDFAGGAPPPPSLATFFLVATLLFTVGTILFGLATNRAAIFPTWTGWALLVSGILAIVSTVVRLAQPSLNPIAADVPFFLFFITLGGMGYWLRMQDVTATSSSVVAPS